MAKLRASGWLSSKIKRTDRSGKYAQRRRARAIAAAIEPLESRLLLSTENWLGGTGNWNVAANWSGNAVPLLGDQVNVALAGSVVNITDAEQVGTITTSTGTTVNMSGGSSLLINNGGTNNGTMNLNASSLANATLTNNGLMTFTNGFNIHTTLMNGTTGTIDLLDDTGLTDNGALINSGTLELNGGSGTAKLNGIQLQDLGGTINVQSGTLSDDQNAVINNATFTIASGAAFAFDPISPSNGGDTFYFSGTSTGTGAGHLIFNSGGVTPGNPDATVTSSILNFPSGFAQVTGTNFLVNPQDGAVQLVTNTGFLNYTGSATHADLGMFNYGTIEVTGTGNIGVSASGPFTNEATGVIDFAADASFVELGGNTGFTNFGTIEKTGGVGTSSIAFNGIDSGTTVNAQTGTIDYPSGFSFNNTMFIAAAGATISLDDTAGGNNFGVSGTLTGSGAGHLILNNGGVDPYNPNGAAPAAILNFPAGFAQVTSASFDVNPQDGAIQEVTNAGFLNFTGSSQHGDLGLDNQGTITVTGSGNLIVDSNGAFTNDTTGVLDFESDAGVDNDGGNTDFVNKGLIEKTAGTGTTLFGITNEINFQSLGGSYNVQTGTISLTNFTSSFPWIAGAISVAANANLDLGNGNGTIYTSGTFTSTGAGHVNFDGGEWVGPLNDGLSVGTNPPATLNFAPGIFFVTDGVFADEQNVTNTGTINYTGSTELDSLDNKGTINVDAGPMLLGGNFVNDIGGTFNLQANTTLSEGGNGVFNNMGLLIKSGGTGTATFGAFGFFDNSGTIEVDSGTLKVPNGAIGGSTTTTTTGTTFKIGANATLRLQTPVILTTNDATIILGGASASFPAINALATNNGTLRVLSGATFTTAGAFVDTGTLTVGGDVTVDGDFTMSQANGSSTPPSLRFAVGAPAGTSGAPDLTVTGNTTLAGTLAAAYSNGFAAGTASAYTVANFATPATGSFSDTSGVGPSFTAMVNPTSIVLNSEAAGAADLAVSSVTAPASFNAGETGTIDYQVTNAGSGTAAAPWVDSIYLSKNATLGITDILLATVTHSTSLAASTSYSGSATVTFPPVIARNYHVLVETDVEQAVPDTNRANNIAASAATTAIVPVLALGGNVSGTIQAGQDLIYQLTIPGGEDVRVGETFAVALQNQLDISDSAIPTTGTGQYSATLVAGSTQTTANLRTPQAGTYYILLSGDAAAGSGQTFTLTANQVGFAVTSASPATVGAGVVTLTINGSGFSGNSTVVLLDGGGNPLATYNAITLNADTLSATLDLTSQSAGTYGLRVTSDGQTATLSSALTIGATSSGAPVVFSLSGPSAVRPGGIYDLYVTYTNPNNTDVPAPLFELDENSLSFRLAGGDPGSNLTTTSGFLSTGIDLLAINQEGEPGILPAHYTGRYDVQIQVAANTPDDTTLMPTLNVDDGTGTLDLSGLSGTGPADINPLSTEILASQIDGLSALPLQNLPLPNGTGYALNQDGSIPTGLTTVTLANLTTAYDNAANTLGTAGVYDPNANDLLSYLADAADGYGTVSQRQQSGSFGNGVPDPLHYALVNADGVTQFISPFGVEAFVPQSDGSYQPLDATDTSVLARQPNGTLRITIPDGSYYQFNSAGFINYIMNPGNLKTKFNYDPTVAGRVTSIIDPNGGMTTYTYDPTYGVVTSILDSVGNTTTFTYEFDPSLGVDFGTENPLSNIPLLDTITTAAGTTTITYTATPVLQYAETFTVDPIDDSQVVTLYYSWTTNPARAFLPKTITYPDGSGQDFTYDGFGRLIKTSNPDGTDPILFSYDSSGLRVTTTYADGSTKSQVIGRGGEPLSVTDGSGQTDTYVYGPDGTLNSILSPLGATTSLSNSDTASTYVNAVGSSNTYSFNANGILTGLTSGNGNSIGLQYNSSQLLTAVTFPDGTSNQYAYNTNQDITQTTTRAGAVTNITRNSLDEILTESYANGTTDSYTYATNGDMLTASGPGGTISYLYNNAQQITQQTTASGSITYTYDTHGRLSQESDQTGLLEQFHYDADARLSEVDDGTGALLVSYTFNSAGAIATKTMGNGTETLYTYTPDGQVATITNENAAHQVISSLAYVYNALQLPITETDQNNQVTTYGYDLAGQLTSVLLPSGQTIAYTYDADGNRVSATNSGVTTNYASNNLDEYTSAGTTTYTYNANGDLKTMTDGSGTTTYIYTAGNQLASSTGPAGDFTYTYNALAQLVSYTDNGVQTNVVEDSSGNVIAEYNASGTLIAHYDYGQGLIAQAATGSSLYYNSDSIGNITSTTDASGAVVNTYSYLPFGETLTSTGPSGNPFTFNGETGALNLGDGLYQMQARTYSPAMGRFIEPDPNQQAAGMNLYRFVNNEPTNQIDPTGLGGEGTATSAEGEQTSGTLFWKAEFTAGVGIEAGVLYNEQHGFGFAVSPRAGEAVGATRGVIPHDEGKNSADLTLNAGAVVGGTVALNPEGHVTGSGQLQAEAGASIGPEFVIYLDQVPSVNPSVVGPDLQHIANDAHHAGSNLTARVVTGDWPAPTDNVKDGKYIPPEESPSGPLNTDTLNNLIRDNHFSQHQVNVQHRRNKANAAFRNGRPRDPNDITGPSSFGTAGFVAPGTFPYTIDFENDPTASVAAQTVVITQQLSSNLDWTTFQLNSFGFGSFNVTVPPGLTSYDTKVNAVATVGLIVDVSAVFNTSTGLLTWTFTSLDPTTLLPTTNALAGFLPPDDSAGDGEGYVSYSVSPSSSDTTGTVINAQAAVVFDTNAPIDTTELTNTIDAGAPTSAVAALSSTQTDSTFTVSWSGQDDANGSGIATYDIYVSENGGAFTPFLTNTTATSSSFAGSPGDSYGFFSVATDNVGNVEAASNAAQATTTVVSDTVILGSDGTLSILGSTADDTIVVSKSAGQIMTTINGTAQTPISASSVASIVLDAGDGNDTVTIDARVPGMVVRGGAGNDTLVALNSGDTLVGNSGDDSITASAGTNMLKGGQGNDSLAGGSGNDALLGGAGNDSLVAGNGSQSLVGGAGSDTLIGGLASGDTLAGSGGADVLIASGGNNLLKGNAGADTLQAGPGNDTLKGDRGHDSIIGGAGSDSLSGGPGADSLVGSTDPSTDTGVDTIDGGSGNNSITGTNSDDSILN